MATLMKAVTHDELKEGGRVSVSFDVMAHNLTVCFTIFVTFIFSQSSQLQQKGPKLTADFLFNSNGSKFVITEHRNRHSRGGSRDRREQNRSKDIHRNTTNSFSPCVLGVSMLSVSVVLAPCVVKRS